MKFRIENTFKKWQQMNVTVKVDMKKTGLFKHHALRIGLSLLLVLPLLLHTLGVINLNVVQRLENYTYDLRLQWTMPNTLDKRIVILDIDEKSLQEQGHWPWPRNKLAHMVDVLFDRYHIDVLGFDMLFAERDESSGLKSLEALARTEFHDDLKFKGALDKLKPQLNYDQVFADSLKNRRVALGYYFRHDGQLHGNVGALPAPALAPGSFDPSSVGAVVASGFTANLPELQKNAASGGFFNASPLVGADGVFRRISLLQMNEGALYETLGLAMARLALRAPSLELGYAGDDKNAIALEFLKLGNRRIPVDMDVAALIPYRGKQGSLGDVCESPPAALAAPVGSIRDGANRADSPVQKSRSE